MAKKSRTREARQRRQKQRRKNQRLLLLVFIVAVAVVGLAVFVVSNQPVEAYIADDLSVRYEGIERSNSPKGYPRLGNADAPVTMEEYASFACPGCESFHSDSFDAVLERVRQGQVLFTYVPLNTGSIPNAPGASRAALCAGQQDKFWEMHDALFDWQTRYGNTAFSQNRLLSGVEKLGLSNSAFTNCFNSAEISATLEAAIGEEVSTTPTLRVNGVTVDASQPGTIPSAATILQAIDDATPDDWRGLAEDSSPERDAAALEEPEAAATPADEGLAPEDEQPALTDDETTAEADTATEDAAEPTQPPAAENEGDAPSDDEGTASSG